jgi:dCTP deaminase
VDPPHGAGHGMIEPFEPGQVKSVNGQKIVSYGTSSYGYDVRCASEFKLFTNLNHTLVDPKNFDPNSFVEVKATPASFRPTRSLWRARRVFPHSAQCPGGLSWARARTPVAASSST